MNDVLKPWILAIDHVGIAVPDLDKALEFYCGTLGLQVTHRETNEEQGVEEAMLQPEYADDDATAIQLLAPLRPDSPIGKFLHSKGPGLQQLAYRVSDVDTVAEALREQGLTLLYEMGKRGTAGSKVNFIHPKDTGGVLVELVQPAPH